MVHSDFAGEQSREEARNQALDFYRTAVWLACLAGMVLLCGCKHAENKPEPKPASAATPQVARAESPPTPAAEATPFLITSSTKWKTVEEFDYQWKADQPATHFKLEIPEGYDDPGDFIRIHIQPKGRPEFVLNNEDGWVEYADPKFPDAYTKLKEQSLVKSKYVLILPYSKNPNEPPLVFLRSWGYASNADRLHVVGFNQLGDPILLLNRELNLEELVDLDEDGHLEIVGLPWLSEEWGSGFLTYSPYYVYKLPSPVDGPATLSIELSKTYNLKNYYGWAGPEFNQKLVVIRHPPNGGKPLIMNADEAEKLMQQRAKAQP